MSDQEKIIGIFPDMNEEEYHANIAMGSTDCKNMLRTARICQYYKENPIEKSSAMSLGIAAHCFLLQRDLFEKKYTVVDATDKRTKEWKDSAKEVELTGMIPISRKQHEQIILMGAEIAKHKVISRLMMKGVFEESHFAIDPETGAYIKCRCDYRECDEELGHYIMDYKTTKVDLSRHGYTRQFANMGGHVQASCYKRTVEITTKKQVDAFLHVAQMSEPPYLVRLFRIPDEWIIAGDSQRYQAWTKISQCQKTGNWPAYEDEGYVDLDDIPAFMNFASE